MPAVRPAPTRSDRISWRSAPATSLLLCLVLVLAGCAPNHVESPSTAAAPEVASPGAAPAPRYRRSGAQGNGAASGPIARIGAAVTLSGPAAMAGNAQRNGMKLAQ